MSFDEGELTPHLVSNYTFDRKEYLIKMYVKDNLLKLCITDNTTSEKWVCMYNSLYIEELTRKTGNYKKFSIFVTMLSSGILRTNNSVKIELMSHTELEALSERKKFKHYRTSDSECNGEADTRKYLILIYTVEFDKIHYPLPLEYCGMPNPRILQKRINILEKEKQRLEEELAQNECHKCVKQVPLLQCKLIKLVEENKYLQEEIKCLTAEINGKLYHSNKQSVSRQERSMLTEKINELKEENVKLRKTIEIMANKLTCVPPTTANNKIQDVQICTKCKLQRKTLNNSKFNSPRSSGSSIINNRKKTALRETASRTSLSSGAGSYKSVTGTRKRPTELTRRKFGNNHSCGGSNSSTDSNLSGSRNNYRGGNKNRLALRRNLSKTRLNINSPTKATLVQQQQQCIEKCSQKKQNVQLRQQQQLQSPVGSKNNYLTPEQLRKQINELVKVVESWSYNLCNNLQLNEHMI